MFFPISFLAMEKNICVTAKMFNSYNIVQILKLDKSTLKPQIRIFWKREC